MSNPQQEVKNTAPVQEANAAGRPEDVPDSELEAVAGGWGHDRWYHHHEGRRGYYRNGAFIQLNL